MLMWPFPALRIKTDFKVFSEILLQSELRCTIEIFGEIEGELLSGFLKYVLNKNH